MVVTTARATAKAARAMVAGATVLSVLAALDISSDFLMRKLMRSDIDLIRKL